MRLSRITFGKHRSIKYLLCILLFVSITNLGAFFFIGHEIIGYDPIISTYIEKSELTNRLRHNGKERKKSPSEVTVVTFSDTIPKKDIIKAIIDINNKCEPAVIGIDILFSEEKRELGDTILYNFAKENRNIVFICNILDSLKGSDVRKFNDISYSHFATNIDDITMGYGNSTELLGYAIQFKNYTEIEKREVPSFAAQIVSCYLGKPIPNNSRILNNNFIDYYHYHRSIYPTVRYDYHKYHNGKDQWEAILNHYHHLWKDKICIVAIEDPDDTKETPNGKISGWDMHTCIVLTILEDLRSPQNKSILFYLLVILLVSSCFVLLQTSEKCVAFREFVIWISTAIVYYWFFHTDKITTYNDLLLFSIYFVCLLTSSMIPICTPFFIWLYRKLRLYYIRLNRRRYE